MIGGVAWPDDNLWSRIFAFFFELEITRAVVIGALVLSVVLPTLLYMWDWRRY